MTTLPVSVPTTLPANVPTARQVRVRLRRGRRAHHTRSLGEFLTDAYVLVLFGGMYGWALVDAGRRYLHSPSSGRAEPGERYWLCVAAVLAAAGLAWQGLRAVGPLLVSPAAQTWAAGAPIDRRAWLLPRFAALIAGAAAGVAVLGLGAATLGGAADFTDFGRAALAGAACGAGGAALSVVAQSARHGRRWPYLLGVGLLGAGAVVAVVVLSAHFAGGRLGQSTMPLTAAIAAIGLPLAVTATLFATRALPRVDRAALTTGAQFANAAAAAAVMLDPSMLAGLIASRRWRSVGRVRSRRFLPGSRWWVLLQAEIRRLYRHPSSVAAWSAVALLQYAVAVALPSLAGSAHVLGAYLAADRLTGGLRALSRSPGLRRALGGGDTELRLAHIVVPAVGTALWWLITEPVGGAHLGWVEVLLVLGVVGAITRAGTRPPLAYGGAIVDTPFGMIPVDLLRQLLRGPDVLAVLVIAQILLA
jgi:hypothetical protein